MLSVWWCRCPLGWVGLWIWTSDLQLGPVDPKDGPQSGPLLEQVYDGSHEMCSSIISLKGESVYVYALHKHPRSTGSSTPYQKGAPKEVIFRITTPSTGFGRSVRYLLRDQMMWCFGRCIKWYLMFSINYMYHLCPHYGPHKWAPKGIHYGYINASHNEHLML